MGRPSIRRGDGGDRIAVYPIDDASERPPSAGPSDRPSQARRSNGIRKEHARPKAESVHQPPRDNIHQIRLGYYFPRRFGAGPAAVPGWTARSPDKLVEEVGGWNSPT